MNVTEFMSRQSKVLLVVSGVVLLIAVCLGSLSGGRDIELSVLYLIPVSWFALFIGRRSSISISLMSAVSGLLLNRANHPSVDLSVQYWNALAWLAAYVFVALVISEVRTLYERERTTSRTDTLTRVSNRRGFFEKLEFEKNRARRYRRPLTVAYLDLDHFKEVNDSSGHHTGDRVLRTVAELLKRNIRNSDVVARLGGDEFAMLLPESDHISATRAITKLRSLLDGAMEDEKWPVTFSIGLVTFEPPPDSIEDIINVADKAMYAAKNQGRGKIVIYPAA